MQKKLDSLKRRTKASKRPVKEFTAPNELGEFVLNDLTKLIELHWHKESEQSPLEAERASHEAFASTRRRAYILNPIYLNIFNEFVAADKHDVPLVICGISGIGKSSLMAYLAHSYERRNQGAFVISHYIGASTSTSDHSGLLRHICLEIKERLSLEEEIPSTTEDLTREFSNWLAKVQDEKLVIFVDALNQLEGNSVNLGWLPSYLPPNIAFVCSTTECAAFDNLRERKALEIAVTPLQDEERESIIVRFLGEYHKGLSGLQSRRIAMDPKSSVPLFLLTMLEELRLVGNFEKVDSHIDHYLQSEDLDDLFRRVLERMERDYGAALLEEFMTLLWSSRRGLSESELLDLLAVTSVAPDNQPVTRLDLSLLLNALDYHLIRKDGLLSFFHGYLRNAVEKRYLENPEKQKALHYKLGRYFATLPISKRRTDEEPWQWQNAEAWEEFNSCLTDIPMLEKLLDEERLYELIGYWLILREHTDAPSEYRKALKTFEETTADKERLGALYTKLGNAFHLAGSYEPAEHFLRRAIEIRESLFGSDHPVVAESLNELGKILIAKGDYTEAEVLCRRSNDIYLKECGEMNVMTARSLNNLAALLYSIAKYDEAETIFRKVLLIREGLLSSEDKDTIESISNLGFILFAKGKLDESEYLFKKSIQLDKKNFGENHPRTAIDINNLASVLEKKNEYKAAIDMVNTALNINRKVLGPEHIETITGLVNLGLLQRKEGNYGNSELTLIEAIEILQKKYGEDHIMTSSAKHNLAQAYAYQEKFKESEALYLRVLKSREKKLGIEHPETLHTMYSLGRLYMQMGNSIKAKEMIWRSVELRAKILGKSHPSTKQAVQSLLELLLLTEEKEEFEQVRIEYSAS